MTLLILHVNQGEWDRSTPNHEGGGHISFPAGPQPGTSLTVWWGRIYMGGGKAQGVLFTYVREQEEGAR